MQEVHMIWILNEYNIDCDTCVDVAHFSSSPTKQDLSKFIFKLDYSLVSKEEKEFIVELYNNKESELFRDNAYSIRKQVLINN